MLFDWSLYPTERQTETNPDPTAEPQPEPAGEPATANESLGGHGARLMRPSDVWADRRAATAPPLAPSEQVPLSSVEEIGAALLFVQWKPGRMGLRDNFRYDNSSTGVRNALGIARPLDHRFVIHQSPSLPPARPIAEAACVGTAAAAARWQQWGKWTGTSGQHGRWRSTRVRHSVSHECKPPGF